MPMLFVYATAADAEEASRLGRALVEARLAACATVIAGARSVYWWEGKLAEASEAVLILKTQPARLDALVTRLRALHSYDCPCIEAIPVSGGNPEFLAWVERETAATE